MHHPTFVPTASTYAALLWLGALSTSVLLSAVFLFTL